MFTWYNLFKFVHVGAVIVWLGGIVAVTLASVRLVRERDGARLLAFADQAEFLGRVLLGPGAALTMLAGLAMLPFMGWSFPFWVVWGLVGMVLAAAFARNLLRKAELEVVELVATAEAEDPRLEGARRRLVLLNVVHIGILLSIVWAMVFKPTL